MKLRLDRVLTEMTTGSRSEVKQWIRQGRVSIDGELVNRPETKVDPEMQEIMLDGEVVQYHPFEYYMLNKPAGVVSATTDANHKTVISLIAGSHRKDLFPVGRLDIDTEGLLLITNDGDLAHRLLSPKNHVDKTYFVRVQGALTEGEKEILEQGMDIGDEKLTLPAVVERYQVLEQNGAIFTEVYFTIREGRYHQVKRMFAGVGKNVIYLKRVGMGKLTLDEHLAVGEYRELTKTEIDLLKRVDFLEEIR